MVRMTGSWRTAAIVAANLGTIMHKTSMDYAKRVALFAKSRALLHIRNQGSGLSWAAHSKSYKAKKRRLKREKMYILTNFFRSSITAKADSKIKNSRMEYYAVVGVPTSAKMSQKTFTIKRKGKRLMHYVHKPHPLYMRFLEYGNSKQPARPLWSPTYKETSKFIQSDVDGFNRILSNNIRNIIR